MSAHAAVIGGGIAGLLAAHALAGRFERVTIVEDDFYPTVSSFSAPATRRGAPQSRCVHVLMAAGAAAFEELMPGWSEAMGARGAGPFDASSDALLHLSAGWLPRTPSGITAYACSRALLEDVLRRRFTKSIVHLREGQQVLGLLSSPLGGTVTGVRMRERRGSGETTLLADLVVDASGAGSALPRLRARLRNGVGSQVKKSVVKSRNQYVSRWFHLEPGEAPEWHCLSVAPTARTALRAAMMVRAEEGRWGVVLLAPVGEPLPSDDMAFLDFTAGLGDGKLREALVSARPISRIHRYGHISNRMIHYEALSDWPAGVIALGDSVCALDPYFGLGMTTAAQGAVLVRKFLDRESNGAIACLEFQKELASLNTQPWRLATGCDLDGRPLARDEAHLRRLYDAAPSSPEIAHALLAVQHLLRPAGALTEVGSK